MLRNPLVALDASAGSVAATDAACMLARQYNGTVHGVHVLDIVKLEGSMMRDLAGAVGVEPFMNVAADLERLLTGKGRVILNEFLDRAKAAGVAASAEMSRGMIAAEIIAAGESRSLIVVGRQGEHAAWKGPGDLGPVAEAVARRARVPVWINSGAAQPPRSIVVGFDGSPRAARALDLARDLAESFAGTLTVVCAGERDEDAHVRAAEARGLTQHAQCPSEVQAQVGQPATAILAAAQAAAANLIVLGAYGHNRLMEWLLGSTTDVVVRGAAAAVLLAR